MSEHPQSVTSRAVGEGPLDGHTVAGSSSPGLVPPWLRTLRALLLFAAWRLAFAFVVMDGGYLDRAVLAPSQVVTASPALLFAVLFILALGIRRGMPPFIFALCFEGPRARGPCSSGFLAGIGGARAAANRRPGYRLFRAAWESGPHPCTGADGPGSRTPLLADGGSRGLAGYRWQVRHVWAAVTSAL